jgi:hypothetical protein
MSTICMKFNSGIHIGMNLVCFSKTRCDSGAPDPGGSAAARLCVGIHAPRVMSGRAHGIRRDQLRPPACGSACEGKNPTGFWR